MSVSDLVRGRLSATCLDVVCITYKAIEQAWTNWILNSWETTKTLLIMFGHSWFDCLQWVWEVEQWMIEQTIILYEHDLNRIRILSKQWIRWWQLLSASSVYNVQFKYLNSNVSLLECLRACDLVWIWDAACWWETSCLLWPSWLRDHLWHHFIVYSCIQGNPLIGVTVWGFSSV